MNYINYCVLPPPVSLATPGLNCFSECFLELCPWATLRIFRRNSPEKLITLFTVRILFRMLFSALPGGHLMRAPRRNISPGSVPKIVFSFLIYLLLVSWTLRVIKMIVSQFTLETRKRRAI